MDNTNLYELLINVVSSSGQKSGDTVKVTIEGVLP